MPALEALEESVRRDGFAGPIPLLTRSQCALLVSHLRAGTPPPPLDWHKGLAATDRLLLDIAIRPAVLATVRPLLGEDVVLWGASFIGRLPGQRHVWHTDIETASSDVQSASLWIGLENVSRESSLQFVTRSHLFGKPIQQVLAERGKARGEAGDEEVLSLARGLDPEARIAQLDMGDGDGVVFDGRLWHASNNTLPRGRRLALLLQYAGAGSRIEQPDLTQLEWPFGDRGEPAPSILVSGAPDGTPNRLVPAPAAEDSVRLGPEIRDLGPSLAEDPATAWRPYPQFAGATPNVTAMGCHVSVLSPGHSPHPPHTHLEEELLVVLDGEAEVTSPEGPVPRRRAQRAARPRRLRLPPRLPAPHRAQRGGGAALLPDAQVAGRARGDRAAARLGGGAARGGPAAWIRAGRRHRAARAADGVPRSTP